jgi:hypothetical protein
MCERVSTIVKAAVGSGVSAIESIVGMVLADWSIVVLLVEVWVGGSCGGCHFDSELLKLLELRLKL